MSARKHTSPRPEVDPRAGEPGPDQGANGFSISPPIDMCEKEKSPTEASASPGSRARSGGAADAAPPLAGRSSGLPSGGGQSAFSVVSPSGAAPGEAGVEEESLDLELPAAPTDDEPAPRGTPDLMTLLVKHRPPGPEYEQLRFDFEAAPEPPCYIVDGLIEPGTVNVLSGDTGTGKSWFALGLVVAALRGEPWLGREVRGSRMLVIDEENPQPVIRARLRALGMTNDDRAALRYYSRNGISIGADGDTEWLRRVAQEHAPDLIVIDTAMAATSVPDVNDNSAVVVLFKHLRALAEEAEAAILMLHHERKPQANQSRDTGQAMMGARQWAGQADAHLTLRFVGREVTPGEIEHERHRTVATLQVPKLRDGVPPPPETVAITSEKDERGWLAWAHVESEGLAEKTLTKAEQLSRRIVKALEEHGEMGSGDLCTRLDVEQTSSTWRSALKKALDGGLIRRIKRGRYGPPEVAL